MKCEGFPKPQEILFRLMTKRLLSPSSRLKNRQPKQLNGYVIIITATIKRKRSRNNSKYNSIAT